MSQITGMSDNALVEGREEIGEGGVPGLKSVSPNANIQDVRGSRGRCVSWAAEGVVSDLQCCGTCGGGEVMGYATRFDRNTVDVSTASTATRVKIPLSGGKVSENIAEVRTKREGLHTHQRQRSRNLALSLCPRPQSTALGTLAASRSVPYFEPLPTLRWPSFELRCRR